MLSSCSRAPALQPGISPDNRISIVSGVGYGGGLNVSVWHDGRMLVAPSPVGFDLADAPIGRLVRVAPIGAAVSTDPQTGDRCTSGGLVAREREGQRRLLRLETKACDNGAAFRLVMPAQPGITSLQLAGETTRFVLPRNDSCLGVRHVKYFNSHEGDYATVRSRAIKVGDLYDLPLTCMTGQGGETYALTESRIENYAGAYLTGTSDESGIAVRLAPRPENKGLAVTGPVPPSGLATPWRVVMIADRPEKMIGNRLVFTLAAPSRIGDASWVMPGKAAWGWWSGLLAPDVPNAGQNMATYRRYIDFAARLGLPYYVIDEGWAQESGRKNVPADVMQPAAGIDVAELVRYARSRNVRIWLWADWQSLNGKMDPVLARWTQWGVAGFKIDFIYRQDQDAVAFYHKVLAEAARYRLLANIHAAFVPRGLDRTYPNFLTQEGAMGNEYNRWSRKVTAGYDVRAAYSRATIGPMDYTPGGFRNVTPAAFRPKGRAPEVMTTRAQQLALFVIFPSPLAVLADAPVAYRNKEGGWAPGVEFLREVPTVWDETHGIAGEFGTWIAVARRHGKRWYIGAITDDKARKVALPLSFLGKGEWKLRGWLDGKLPSDLNRRQARVTATTRLGLNLGPSGGAALILEQ